MQKWHDAQRIQFLEWRLRVFRCELDILSFLAFHYRITVVNVMTSNIADNECGTPLKALIKDLQETAGETTGELNIKYFAHYSQLIIY